MAEHKEEVLPVIHLRIRVSRPIEEVWEKFLDPIMMLQWLGDEISADVRVGGTIRFLGPNAPTTPELANYWDIKEVKDQKVRTAFFKVGETKIELLESTEADGPVGKFIEKRGPGIHHIAFAMDDTDQALKEAGAKGVQLIDKSSRKGAEGLKIGFLHPRSTFGVLTEFCSH